MGKQKQYPPMPIGMGDGGPIMGWSSWGVVQGSLTDEIAFAASDYYKEHFQDWVEEDGGVFYINLDSWWNEAFGRTMEVLRRFVEHCQANGQKVGIYHTPFACWEWQYNDAMKDMVLHDENGNRLPTWDSAYPFDVTHPAVIAMIEEDIQRFIDAGFSYIKLDFLSYGAMEGVRFDKNVQTGIQAYNQAMARIVEQIDGRMFINLSIAPIFRINTPMAAASPATRFTATRLYPCIMPGNVNREPLLGLGFDAAPELFHLPWPRIGKRTQSKRERSLFRIEVEHSDVSRIAFTQQVDIRCITPFQRIALYTGGRMVMDILGTLDSVSYNKFAAGVTASSDERGKYQIWWHVGRILGTPFGGISALIMGFTKTGSPGRITGSIPGDMPLPSLSWCFRESYFLGSQPGRIRRESGAHGGKPRYNP